MTSFPGRKKKANDPKPHYSVRQKAINMDLGGYLQFVIALLFVLALILIIAYGAKRFGLMARITINSDRSKRLNIVEILPVDARRKLILIRRDDVEHLVMLSATHDIVIEKNIPPMSPEHMDKAENK